MTDPADPAGPKSGPDWRPRREPESNISSIVVGIIFLAIGVWYLLDQTLGLDMPRINWRDFWPIILIVFGGIMLYRSAKRRT